MRLCFSADLLTIGSQISSKQLHKSVQFTCRSRQMIANAPNKRYIESSSIKTKGTSMLEAQQSPAGESNLVRNILFGILGIYVVFSLYFSYELNNRINTLEAR